MRNLIFIFAILFIISGCNSSQLNSVKPNVTPTIDGQLSEWQGMITPQNESFGIGVMNDDSNLYLSMSTYDEHVIMKVLNGLTIWINKEGKKNQSFGIKYPLKQDLMGMQGMPELGGMRNLSESREEHQEMMIQQRLTQQENIILINDNIEQLATMDNGINGIKLNMNYDNGDLIYEIKIPFIEISLEEKDKISIGIETEQMQKPEMGGMRGGDRMLSGERPSGGMRGGGMGSGRPVGGMGDGRPAGGMSGIQDMMKPLNVWIKVKLLK